jgi:small GTP-binding protein
LQVAIFYFEGGHSMSEENSSQEPGNDFLRTLGEILQDQALGLPPEHQRRLQQEIDRVVNYYATVGVLGKSGAGKSALCNALFGKEETEVSDVEAGTLTPQEITLISKQGKGISLIDMPGVGESQQRDETYRRLYRKMLPELDLVLWVIKADDRALSVDEQFYQQIVRSAMQERQLPVLFVVSQIDKIEPCREWDWRNNQPGPLQRRNIETKLECVRRAFHLTSDQICAIAAVEGYALVELVDKVMLHLPNEKRWGFAREAKQETVSAEAWKASARGLWEMVKTTAAELLKEGWQQVYTKLTWLADKLSWAWR